MPSRLAALSSVLPTLSPPLPVPSVVTTPLYVKIHMARLGQEVQANHHCYQDVGRNVCHGSDSVENAKKEIALWFKPEEVQSWKKNDFSWVFEKE